MQSNKGTLPVAQDKAAEQDFYDRLFRDRGRFDQFQREIYERVAREAGRSANGGVALDLGCGSGTQSFCLMDEGFAVVSADLSFEAAKLTRANAAAEERSLAVVNADAEFLPFPDGSVDACVCSLFLHHFKSLDALARELRRVVREGGVVIATDANAHNPFVWLFFNVVHRVHPLSWLTPNQRALSRGEIKQAFEAAGFGDFRFESFSTELKRDWLGDSFAYSVNFHLRRILMSFSRILPGISRGNGLMSIMLRRPAASRRSETVESRLDGQRASAGGAR